MLFTTFVFFSNTELTNNLLALYYNHQNSTFSSMLIVLVTLLVILLEINTLNKKYLYIHLILIWCFVYQSEQPLVNFYCSVDASTEALLLTFAPGTL
jgi:hypothetical protein